MIEYKHDGDGKIYYEDGDKVVWLAECNAVIDGAQGVVDILNKSQTNTQQLKAEICSNNCCDYCVKKSNDMPCSSPCRFVGRKLSAV